MSNILWEMGQINRCGGMYRTDRLPENAPPAFHHNFIIAVCRYPGSSQDQLARLLCLNKSTVTRRLTYLEENGYVTRLPSACDKRVMLVHPTEKALEFLPQITTLTNEWNDAITLGISDDELKTFHSVLSAIARRARELTGMDDERNGGGE